MIYLQESFITLSWDEASKTIVAEWKGFASLAKMQFALEKGLELIQQKRLQNGWGTLPTWLPSAKNPQTGSFTTGYLAPKRPG